MRYRRRYIPGGTYFITAALADRKNTLLKDKIDKLRSAFKKVMYQHPFDIHAIVILPDHFHMLITLPDEDVSYSKRIRLIKSNFSKNIECKEFVSSSRARKAERGIWQRRFWEHSIRDEKDYAYHVNYIHYNPVKHKYVLNPIDWPYSSIHRYVRAGILQPNWSASI